MKLLFLLILGCFAIKKGVSQTQLDTMSIYESAKYLLIAEQKTIKLDEFKTNYLPSIKIKKLKSNGFEHVQFILMEYRGFINNNEVLDSEFKKNNVPHSCDYIVVFIGGIYFRLKGFINNDFYQFMEYYSENSYIGFLMKRDIFSKRKFKTFKQLIEKNNIFVEDLDLTCYYKYYLLQQKVQKKLGNNFCSESCIYNIKKQLFPY